ncbi:SDR family oxidoreductase [Leptothoe sp. PORK10 BA2]|uniref:SDR family oxidoreductase n=1 Tax=Leptothoe sp. PORK10 BA2 TaxID=3110254 RepID=UPI002B205F38|nr:SDR family oxidoreductase [Leptothoe sp. PORK10 BA2]MEA5466137.1 SDR family oxidoreductase [Leptothoe sp. PORK10 BA2]
MNRNQTALVTGSGVRLGKAIAIALAKAGFDIALHYNSSQAKAKATQAEILALGVQCETFQQDLSQAEALDDFLQTVQAKMPTLAVLVNSASVYDSGEIADTSVAIFEQQFAVNLRAPFFLSRAFAKAVETGNIINICDNKIAFNQYEYAAYLLSKKTLAEFTKLAALEFAPHIRVNGVSPGVVMPAGSRSEDYINWRIQGIPVQRQGHTDNITQAIVSLIDNDFMTGQILFVDGGESITNVGRNATQFDPNLV